MAKKLYVGNLSFSITDEQLAAEFEQFGPLVSARVITDRDSGRSKGFGFVELENDADAMTALEKMNGAAVGGRNLNVSEARPQEPRSGGGGGGFRGGGGGGRGGGGRGGGGYGGGGGGGGRY